MLNIKNKATGLLYEFQHEDTFQGKGYCAVVDEAGELRLFRKEVMERIPVEDEWEDVLEDELKQTPRGLLILMWTRYNDGEEEQLVWTYPNSKGVRLHDSNGRISVQRKKKRG